MPEFLFILTVVIAECHCRVDHRVRRGYIRALVRCHHGPLGTCWGKLYASAVSVLADNRYATELRDISLFHLRALQEWVKLQSMQEAKPSPRVQKCASFSSDGDVLSYICHEVYS
eukprot:m.1051981 g.1051981  ORF g.1051981 m.1051981 type:complete len:115 (-) comp24181_c0_seq8:105-449(-)